MSILCKVGLIVSIIILFSGLLVSGSIVFARAQTPKISNSSVTVSNSFTDGIWSGNISVSRLSDETYQVQAGCTMNELLPWPEFTHNAPANATPLNYKLGCNAGHDSELITISPTYSYHPYYTPTPLTYGVTYSNPIVTEGPFSDSGANLLSQHQTQDQQWCVGIDTESSVWALDDTAIDNFSEPNNSDFACVNSQDATLPPTATPILPTATPPPNAPTPAAYLERAGGSIVSGWACDNANGSQTSQVDVYANGPYNNGGTYLGGVQADINRPDLVSANVCGGTPNHGFQYDASGAGPGQHTIWAYNKVSGTVTVIGNSGNVTVSNPTANPDAYMVSAGGSKVSGWACDDAYGNQTSQVDFYANGPYNSGGTYIGGTVASGNRPDLTTSGKCGNTPSHGFVFDMHNAGSGIHSVWAYNKVNGTVTVVGNSGNVTVDNGPPNPASYMMSVNNNTITGWACDDAFGNQTSRVDFYKYAPYGQGGVYIEEVTANINRPDLVSAGVCGGTPNHGFQVTLPTSRAEGQYTVWAYNLVSGTVTLVGNSGNVTVGQDCLPNPNRCQ